MAKEWKPSERTDDVKDPNAGYYGGFQLTDEETTSRMRGAATELVKMAGKKILSGDFNLTRISFPIKCMSPESILPIIATMSIHSPIYLTAAGLTDDPLLRMKYVITNALSYYYPCHIFDKPLNPILGETYQGRLADGAQVYME